MFHGRGAGQPDPLTLNGPDVTPTKFKITINKSTGTLSILSPSVDEAERSFIIARMTYMLKSDPIISEFMKNNLKVLDLSDCQCLTSHDLHAGNILDIEQLRNLTASFHDSTGVLLKLSHKPIKDIDVRTAIITYAAGMQLAADPKVLEEIKQEILNKRFPFLRKHLPPAFIPEVDRIEAALKADKSPNFSDTMKHKEGKSLLSMLSIVYFLADEVAKINTRFKISDARGQKQKPAG